MYIYIYIYAYIAAVKQHAERLSPNVSRTSDAGGAWLSRTTHPRSMRGRMCAACVQAA